MGHKHNWRYVGHTKGVGGKYECSCGATKQYARVKRGKNKGTVKPRYGRRKRKKVTGLCVAKGCNKKAKHIWRQQGLCGEHLGKSLAFERKKKARKKGVKRKK